jgi:hypothetical protein
MSRSSRLASAGLVAAAVLAITACGSSTSSGGVAGATGTPATSAAPASAPASAAASAAPSGSGLNQAVLQFQQANNSGITGGAIVTDLGNNQSAVTIGVVAAGVTDPMPANLAPGDCATMTAGGASASPGASGSAAPSAAASVAASAAPSAAASGSAEPSGSPIPLNPGDTAKLGDLSAGASNTVVNIGLDGLLSQPYTIVIYKSAADMTVVACADVKK